MTVEALPGLEIVEQLDDAATCEDCEEAPATWLVTVTCDTPGCPDEHNFLCVPCLEKLKRYIDPTDECAWCALVVVVYHFEPL